MLKKPTKARINLLWLLACLSYGLLFISYEKSGNRCVQHKPEDLFADYGNKAGGI